MPPQPLYFLFLPFLPPEILSMSFFSMVFMSFFKSSKFFLVFPIVS